MRREALGFDGPFQRLEDTRSHLLLHLFVEGRVAGGTRALL